MRKGRTDFMVFFTLEDPRAKVQGSRDPLGVQPIWSRFGRDVVCNLTTVSRAVRGFSVLLVGRYLANTLVETGKATEDDAINLFLKFEQVAAYSRQVAAGGAGDDIILGVNRVKQKLVEGKGGVQISEHPRDQILSDQKAYGLWGLYSVPARVSGLLLPGALGITQLACDFVEAEYLPRLRKQENNLMRLLSKGGSFKATQRNQLCKTIVETLGEKLSANEIAFYGQTLRDASQCEPEKRLAARRQSLLAGLIKEKTVRSEAFSYSSVDSLRQHSEESGEGELAACLTRILGLEAAIAPAQHVFDYVMSHNGVSPKSVADSIKDQWGTSLPLVHADLSEIMPVIRETVGDDQASCLQHTNESLAQGDYQNAIKAVIDWNSTVMQARGASGWMGNRRGKLVVKLREQSPNLPATDDARFSWVNSYFLGSLKDITFQLEPSNV